MREARDFAEDGSAPDAHAAEAGRLWVHFAFGAAYVVLLLRLLPLVTTFSEGGWFLPAVNTACNLFAGQFTNWFSWFGDDPRMFVPDVIFALFAYGVTHYAVTSRLPEYDGESRMLKVMYFCRSVLYLFVTLLVLLVIVRMFILIYHDLTPMRFGVIRSVNAPK
jgi:hypothetical protein